MLLSDESLEYKYGDDEPNTALGPFSQVDRFVLWRGYENHHWHWTFDRWTPDWYAFRDKLIETAAAEGFELEFVTLMGPDYLARHHDERWRFSGYWGSKTVMVSDAGRSAESLKWNGTLLPVHGCDSWRYMEGDIEAARHRAKNVAAWLED